MVPQERKDDIESEAVARKSLQAAPPSYVLVLLAALCSASLGASQPMRQNAFLDVQDIVDAWEATYGAIHTMKMSYTETRSGTTDPNRGGSAIHETVERIQDGKRFRTKCSSSEPYGPGGVEECEAAFDGSASYYYEPKEKRGWVEPGIRVRGLEAKNSPENYLWLTRYYVHPDYPEGETYFAFWIRSCLVGSTKSARIKVTVRPELETVLGEPCHVVELREGDRGRRFWIAHGKGMLPMKYESFVGQAVTNMIAAREIARVMTDSGEVWYPSDIERIGVNPKTGRTESYRCEVREFTPHIDIAPDTFKIVFPEGTTVHDRVGHIIYSKDAMKHALDDVQIGAEEPQQAGNTPNTAAGSKASNGLSEESSVRSDAPAQGEILGNAQGRTGRKYGYVFVTGLALIALVGVLRYRRHRVP